MKKSLLDTNIITAFLKGNEKVIDKINDYLNNFDTITLSVITYYEIIRGLKAMINLKKLRAFEEFMKKCEIEELTKDIAEQASGIYTELRKDGELIEDADILIAATAIKKGFTLITDNESHFKRIKNLEIENWLSS